MAEATQTDPKWRAEWLLKSPSVQRLITPTSGYIFIIIGAIGLLLLLSGDVGESWDVASREHSASLAYTYYFNGFDSAYLRANPDSDRYYGPLLDVFIKIAQDTTADTLEKFHIRIFLQALLSLSCLIPVFLISARVVSKPLALIAVALVAATPVFLGHAFINPKDSVFASGFLWAFYFIVYCFEDDRRKRSYWALIGLGAILGMVTSLRLIGAYLLLLVAGVAVILPAFRAQATKASFHRSPLVSRLYDQTALQFSRLAVLLLSFAITYTLSMPSILSDLSAHAFMDSVRSVIHHGWGGTVLYFGQKVFPLLPWHYYYGYMLVKLPLYYHFFLFTVLVTSILSPRATIQALRDFLLSGEPASAIIFLLTVALIIPLVLVSFVPSLRYDELRHMLFMVPPICMLLYFGFVAAIARMRRLAGVMLMVLIAVLCWSEAVIAGRSLHPYEYVYYNPLVNPAGSFELDYWGTSFRELAERLNDYARNATMRGEKLRLFVCGPSWTLTHFLDPAMFDITRGDPDYVIPKASDVHGTEAAPQLIVALNRGRCMTLVNGRPWLISIKRQNLVFAVVARS